ncbi:MAG: 30S ribosomal protein S2 [Deltaproteobacteria bacterium]|nr:30S ribosomal protein S2 [Deltaproteobacteria bacterium]
MSEILMKDLLEAGAHFGHQTRRWNPKMKPYIYGARNGIHIIDLSITLKLATEAINFAREVVSQGQDVLFVGTKRQAQDIVREEAEKSGMFYVCERWLGGTLTNFKTIKASIDRLHDLQTKKEDGTFAALSKKENLNIDREIQKFEKSLGGIKHMVKLPGLVVVVDPKKEKIAIHEAKVLGIPVVAMADTNCDPEDIDCLVPCNDDSIRAIRIILGGITEAIQEGKQVREENARAEGNRPLGEEKKAVGREKGKGKPAAYVSKPESEEEGLQTFSATAVTEEKTE